MSELVFKIMKAGASFHAIDYNARKDSKGLARLVHFEGFGPLQDGRTTADPKALKAYLEQFGSRNTRIRQPQFHAILSVRGRSMETSNMIAAARTVLNRLGYTGNPIAIYEHNDTANRHLHIITSRVGLNGQKINDKFEGIRAQQALQEILLIDPAVDFHHHMVYSLQYRFSSVRQFMLLMEAKGYTCRQHQGNIRFYKHGYQQGNIETGVIKDHMKHHPVAMNGIDFIREMIFHERIKHPATLQVSKIYGHKGGTGFSSPLTDVLRDEFGLQSVFFASPGQHRPYGYVIIDHVKRNVYKGSDIMPLSELIGISQDESLNTKQREDKRQVWRGDGWPEGEESEKQIRESPGGGEMVRALDQIMAGAERDLMTDNINNKKKKPKRTKYI